MDSLLLRRKILQAASGGEPAADNILTFIAEEANSTIKLAKRGSGSFPVISLQYSTNGGRTWEAYTIDSTITLARVGHSVKFKGENSSFASSEHVYYYFQMTGKIAASGDVTSLINGVGGDVDLTGKNYCFCRIFYNCTALTQAPNLPSTKISNYCYAHMFEGCTSLTGAPNLPAMTIADYCYYYTFYNCSALTTVPTVLPATTLAKSCYANMFYSCISLTNAPALPATELSISCYSNMFNGCSSLTTAPELLAITLAKSCYVYMFAGCTNLNYIKAMFTTTPGISYTDSWVQGVSQTGTFIKNSAASWNVTGNSGIPSDWTVQTASE